MQAFARLVLVALALVVGSSALCDDRIPVPANVKQDNFIASVRETYSTELKAAKALPDKVKLAEKLLLLAVDSKDDVSSQFVLYRDAVDLATQSFDITLAFKAVDQLTERFDENSLELKLKVLQDASNSVRPRESNRSIASQGMELVQQAITVDDFDRAETAAKLAIAAANRVPDAALIKEAAAVVKEIPTLRTAYRQIQPALQVLVDSPADPTAAVTVGKYYCMVKGDWAKGLPLLAIGNDASLKSLAELEVGQPNESAKQVELGDKYWDLANAEQGLRKTRLQEHAAEWYSKALASLTGITKAKVEKRVAEVAKLQHAKAPVVAMNRTNKSQTLIGVQGAFADDLAVAQWVLEKGGKVWGPNNTPVSNAESLKPGFRLFAADLAPDATDSDLARFSSCIALEVLRLNDTKVSGIGLKALGSLNMLRHLEMSGVPLTQDGAVTISGLRNLRHLSLKDTSLDDDGLKALKNLQLGLLICQNTRVTDRGLLAVKDMMGLTSVNFRNTRISGEGLKYLAGLRLLKGLDLLGTDIDDEGLEHLRGLNELNSLYVGGTKVTNDGVSSLKKHLPLCNIVK
jgi:hypothetical protein